jgi:glycine/D-amino acid oxidase-like deaminating enzyme
MPLRCYSEAGQSAAGEASNISLATNLAEYDRTGGMHHLSGIDFIEGQKLVTEAFPYVSGELTSVLHSRRCGWVNAQQMGMAMLNIARENGVRFQLGQIKKVHVEGERVQGVEFLEGSPAPSLSSPSLSLIQYLSEQCFCNISCKLPTPPPPPRAIL